uniref:Protein kinase domain-containing protein n=1 Tax=viral metagenome TaxID=1070528 RepID=A0A6C0AXL4_9ZZZZ|tara:strand:- start:33282 stop:34529 length:1248 start_codon:yes stop_codon:yes gene_type:complete
MKYRLLFLSIYTLTNEVIKYFYHKNIDTLFINYIETLAKKNIFYIKLFQSIATNTELFSKVQINYLLQYLDNVPYDKTEIDNKVFNDITALGISNKEFIIDTESLKPINSGMIAIVYKSRMGENDIIVKIKKLDIHKKVYNALDEVEVIINILNIIPFFKYYYLKELFYESKKILLNQLDFDIELKNLNSFYENNRHTDYLVVPYAYDIFTKKNSNMIVMNYLHGKKFNEIIEGDKLEYSNLIVKFSLKSILFNRLFHADLHGGNIIFMKKDNIKQIGIIDFGIAGTISQEEQNICYTFIKEIFIQKDFEAATNILLTHITVYIQKNVINITDNNVFNKIKRLLENSFSNNNHLDIIISSKVNKILIESNMKLSPLFYKLQYSISSSYTLCINLSGKELFLTNINNMCEKLIDFI